MRVSDDEIRTGLDFILSHFATFPFPRTISTKTTEGRQITVYNRAEALARFKQSNYLDCRINAYSKHDNEDSPNFLLIDIDCTDEQLLSKILSTKFRSIESNPTVLLTGSGYHIYQPIECGSICLDDLENFSNCSEPSRQFLKFAEMYLSNNNSDPNHNPSFKSCMVRIPNSINSKHGVQVKIVQSWDGKRPDIIMLLGSFYAWILTEQKKQQDYAAQMSAKFSYAKGKFQIKWIENKLLKIALDDFRKTITNLVLAPYLVNIRKLPFKESSSIIEAWLNKCKAQRELDFNPNRLITAALTTASKSGYKPMSLSTLKQRNSTIYQMLRTT